MSTLFRSPGLLVIMTLANLPLWFLVARLAFESWGDLAESVMFWLGPFWLQVVDVLRGGDWNEHQWSSLKLVVFVFLFATFVFSEYSFVCTHFPGAVAWGNRVLPLLGVHS